MVTGSLTKTLLLVFIAIVAIVGCGDGSESEGGGRDGQAFVCEGDSCFCTNLSGGMSQTCEISGGFFGVFFKECEDISNSPCPNTSILSGIIEIAFTFDNPPNREHCFVLQTDDGQNIRLVDGPDVNVEDVLFPGASVTVQATLGLSCCLCKPIPIDDIGEVLDIIEISETPIPPPELPPLDFVSVPELISPINNAIIEQNNPDTGCPFDPDRGFGYKIFYDWTDSTSPNGIEIYALNFINDLKTSINRITTSSEFTEIQCNTFIGEGAIWDWRVRAFDNLDFQSQDSETRLFEFGPCLLEDGSPCHNPP